VGRAVVDRSGSSRFPLPVFGKDSADRGSGMTRKAAKKTAPKKAIPVTDAISGKPLTPEVVAMRRKIATPAPAPVVFSRGPTITEWDANSHFLALFAATALLKDEQPQSLLLVGRPSEGKSELVRRFRNWPGSLQVSDITADGLRRVLASEVNTRMILLDEMQRVFSHTFDTVQNITGLLISLMSGNANRELVGPSGKGQHVDLSGRRIGVIAAMPTDVLAARLRDIEATGLFSRFSFLSIVRSQAERDRVRGNIYHRIRTDLEPYPLPPKIPREPVAITTTPEADKELEVWGSDVFSTHDDRKHSMLTVLVRAVALLCGRRRAGTQDVKTLRRFESHLRSLEFRAVATPKPIPPFRGKVSWL
jgi:hypothetical protein